MGAGNYRTSSLFLSKAAVHTAQPTDGLDLGGKLFSNNAQRYNFRKGSQSGCAGVRGFCSKLENIFSEKIMIWLFSLKSIPHTRSAQLHQSHPGRSSFGGVLVMRSDRRRCRSRSSSLGVIIGDKHGKTIPGTGPGV